SLASHRQSPGRRRRSLDLILNRRDAPAIRTDSEPPPGERGSRDDLVEDELPERRPLRGTNAIPIRTLDRAPAKRDTRREIEVRKGGSVRGLQDSRGHRERTRFLKFPSGADAAELARTDADSAAVCGELQASAQYGNGRRAVASHVDPEIGRPLGRGLQERTTGGNLDQDWRLVGSPDLGRQIAL